MCSERISPPGHGRALQQQAIEPLGREPVRDRTAGQSGPNYQRLRHDSPPYVAVIISAQLGGIPIGTSISPGNGVGGRTPTSLTQRAIRAIPSSRPIDGEMSKMRLAFSWAQNAWTTSCRAGR